MGYTAVQAARLSGCSPGQLDTWRRIGLLVPDDTDPTGPYSFRDLVALRMVASLLDAGLPMPRIRRAVAELLRTGDDISGLRLVTDGETVWACRDDGQILDALRHGQLALFVAVDRFASEVEAEARDFDADRDKFLAELRAHDGHPSRLTATPEGSVATAAEHGQVEATAPALPPRRAVVECDLELTE